MADEEAAEIAGSLPTAGSLDLTLAGRQVGVVGVGLAASFGALLRAHREHALLSQEELAQRAGLGTRTVRELEAGRVRRPRGASVRLLARALRLQGSRRQAFEAAARAHSALDGTCGCQKVGRGC